MPHSALVVFSGRKDMWWQCLLRQGFRHCSLILNDGQRWILVEPLATVLQVRALAQAHVDLAEKLRRRGFLVVETALEPPSLRPAPPGLWTCVETVKRGLGIRSFRVQTPWQLFRHIQEHNKKNFLDNHLT